MNVSSPEPFCRLISDGAAAGGHPETVVPLKMSPERALFLCNSVLPGFVISIYLMHSLKFILLFLFPVGF